MWIGASLPVLRWYGHRVGSLGPGLTSESADAARVVLRNDLSAGPQFLAPTGGAGLICLAWTRGRGFTGPTASGCVPSLQPEKRDGIDHRRRGTRRYRRVDTHADTHVAAALDPVGGLLGVREFPTTPAARPAGVARRVRNGVPGRDRGDWRLRPGLTRRVTAAGVRVVEVDRSDRQDRRQGKSDPLDAVSAARAAQSGRRPRRAERPGRHRRGNPRADGRQAQRRLRAHPDD